MRILIVATSFPNPPVDSLTGETYRRVRQLALRHCVTLLAPAREGVEPHHLEEFRALGIRVELTPALPAASLWRRAVHLGTGRLPWPVKFFDETQLRTVLASLAQPGHHDVVHLEHVYLAALLPGALGLPTVLTLPDPMSLDYLVRISTELRLWRRLEWWLEATRARRMERSLLTRARQVVVLTERDARYLRTVSPSLPVAVVPLSVETERFKPLPPPPDPCCLVYHGSLDFGPNREAVTHLLTTLFPAIRCRCRDARLLIAGRGASPAIRRLVHEQPSVTLVEDPEDIRPSIGAGLIHVNPVRRALGTQNKTLEAMAMGRAVVTTPALAVGAGQKLIHFNANVRPPGDVTCQGVVVEMAAVC
ncbi:MAG: glycosyltransferase [Candidatus Wallbacteria bacterium]|nr:glycosyltransferase [Candidatus Wallbacteria bacterium]